MPVFSVKTLLNGKWQDDFFYLSAGPGLPCAMGVDQPGKRRQCPRVWQKKESGILNGKDGWMFTKLFTVSTDTEKQLGKNISAVTNFAQRYPRPGHFLLAPSASDITRKCCRPRPHGGRRCHADDIFARAVQRADVIDMRDDYRANK